MKYVAIIAAFFVAIFFIRWYWDRTVGYRRRIERCAFCRTKFTDLTGPFALMTVQTSRSCMECGWTICGKCQSTMLLDRCPKCKKRWASEQSLEGSTAAQTRSDVSRGPDVQSKPQDSSKDGWIPIYNAALASQARGEYGHAVQLFEEAEECTVRCNSGFMVIILYAKATCLWEQAGLEPRGNVRSMTDANRPLAMKAYAAWKSVDLWPVQSEDRKRWPLTIPPDDLKSAARSAAHRAQLEVSAFDGGWEVDYVRYDFKGILHLSRI